MKNNILIGSLELSNLKRLKVRQTLFVHYSDVFHLAMRASYNISTEYASQMYTPVRSKHSLTEALL